MGCLVSMGAYNFMVSMSNSRLTAVAVPEGTGQGVGPNVQHLAGEGSTVLGEDIARGVGTDQQVAGRQGTGHQGIGWGVGTDQQGTGQQGTGREGTGHQGTGEVGQQVVGTGEAAHFDLWTIRKIMM